MARSLGVAHATVSRHLTRAARCCLLRHAQLLQTAPVSEPIVVDGFETFEFSQYFPYHLNLAVGQNSWFIYHFTDSPLRRKGRMRPEQKARRAELEERFGRPDPKAVQSGMLELLREIVRMSQPRSATPPPEPRVLELHMDEHPAYPRAIRELQRDLDGLSIRAVTTPSTDPRTRANKLFPVNLADLLLRHSGADHRRETIAYGKRRQSGMERAAVHTVWRNWIKWRRENHPGETAAMAAGLLDRRWSWREVFGRRLFPRERELTKVWWGYYWRRVKTAALGTHQTENRAKFAY